MRLLLFLLTLVFTVVVSGENLFFNGNLKKINNFIPLAKAVKEKGFDAKAPWPAGFLIDYGTQACKINYVKGETPVLEILNNGPKETTLYTSFTIKTGSYKLRFYAKGLTPNSYVKVRLYCYNKQNKWVRGILLHQIKLNNSRLNQVLDFKENNPDVASFRIAFSFKGNVSISNISLNNSLTASKKAVNENLKKKVILSPGTFVFDEHPPKIYERCSHIETFGPVTKEKQTIVEFEHRIDFPRLGGWNPCMQIEVNNQVVSAMATRKNTRLLNTQLTRSGHKDYGTFRRNKTSKWYSFYAPDFEAVKNRFVPKYEEAYRVKLDISDLVSSSKNNIFRIRFGSDLMDYYRSIGIKRKPALVIRNLKIYQLNKKSLLPEQKIKEFEDVYIDMKAKEPVKFQAKLKENGAIYLKIKDQTFDIASNFTAPNGHLFALGKDAKNLWKSYKVNNNTLEAVNDFYTLKRSLSICKNRIDVKDTFISNQKYLLGVKFSYNVNALHFHPIYLAGDDSPVDNVRFGGRNPSVFLANRKNNTGLGIIAIDDVFRVQNKQFCENNIAGIGSDNLALSPGKLHVVEWSIYPTNSSSYFDFINQVRGDWNVNFPIKGNFNLSLNTYPSTTKSNAQNFADRLGLTYQTFGVLFWRYLDGNFRKKVGSIHGFGLMLDKIRSYGNVKKTDSPEAMRSFVKKCLALCKEYTPQLKRLIYVHNQYSVEVNDIEKYKDCRLIDLKGRKISTGNGFYNLFVPTENNEFGKKNLEFIKYLFDNYDLDGIYNDEFTHSLCNITSNMWDNFSVELDDKGNVKRKIGYVPLLKLKFNLKVMEYVLNTRKKEFIANFSPETRSELKYQFPRFEETYNSNWVYLSHLYTPIQLGDMLVFNGQANEFMDDVRNALKKGALYYYYLSSAPTKSITSYMYPFTPVEINSGYLVGKERILTIYSGSYGISKENYPYTALVFDQYGKQIKNYPYKNVKTSDGVKCQIKLTKGLCAVLIKNIK